LTGEINEYMELSKSRTKKGEPKYATMKIYSGSKRQWFENVKNYLLKWVKEHKEIKKDTWTPEIKHES
jgi:predicted RNA-binding protein with RPS1 domain